MPALIEKRIISSRIEAAIGSDGDFGKLNLQPGTQLLITVVASDAESDAWYDLSAQNLAAAYSDDEPEYPLTLIKEQNPEYEGR